VGSKAWISDYHVKVCEEVSDHALRTQPPVSIPHRFLFPLLNATGHFNITYMPHFREPKQERDPDDRRLHNVVERFSQLEHSDTPL
jgi:hypothetical protein